MRKNKSLSIVTCVMNRFEHLRISAQAISCCSHHDEHIILDWNSRVPIPREIIPPDHRIRVIRIDNDDPWWLTHAYNCAFAQSSSDIILKLDADIVVGERFLDAISVDFDKADYGCSRLTIQDWDLAASNFITSGIFWVTREALTAVQGFNPYIQGWGWDEIDIFSRLFLSGYMAKRIPGEGVEEILHHDSLRQSQVHSRKLMSWLNWDYSDLLQLHNSRNRIIARLAIEYSLQWPSLQTYFQACSINGRPPSLPNVVINACDIDNLYGSVVSSFLGRVLAKSSFPPLVRSAIFRYCYSRRQWLANELGIIPFGYSLLSR